MSLASKRAVPIVHAAEPKDTAEASTFFAAGTPPAPQTGSKPAPQAPTPEAPKKPARTFFDAMQADPIFNLSTHRAPQVITAEQRQERKEFEEERARVGLSNLMAKILGH